MVRWCDDVCRCGDAVERSGVVTNDKYLGSLKSDVLL